MPTPVLVFADDGSLEADRAWLWVTQQAWPGWELEVFSCQPPPIGPPIGALRARPRPWTPPEPRDAATAGFETTRHLLAEDDPRIVLTERDDAGLLVLGQKGRGALKALHLGSTAEYVVQHLPAPVVVAKRASAVRSVLVCTDGTTHAQRATEALLAMPWLPQIDTVRVIGVYHVGIYDDSAEISTAVDATLERLTLAPALTCSPIPILRDDNPAYAILGEAEAMSADLIVLGTRGLSALRLGLLWGSTARAVTKTAISSVLVAHTP